MTLPQQDGLSVGVMNGVFGRTTATYKFYWLLSLLDIYVKEHRGVMRAIDVAARMVAYAWYPVEYFKLSFGKSDSMGSIIHEVAKLTGITVNDKLEDKNKAISDAVENDKHVKDNVKVLLRNVPFWFLSPWLDKGKREGKMKSAEVVERSQRLENDCLYSLSGTGDNLELTINPNWKRYLETNYEILRGFTLWHLSLFLQSKNPNVPNIPGKLIRPERRESLNNQKNFWNKVIELGADIHCIYTGKLLDRGDFDLDHFIPWSFVSHNQNWNLIPADSSFNSSKSDKIPELDFYLPKFANVQHEALKLYVPKSKKNDKILEEYFALGVSPQDLMQMSSDAFLEVYRNTFSPLCQMAVNMGFGMLNPV